MENNELIRIAIEASKNAHCPYSNFTVGAALVSSDGKLYTGCNIENQGIMSVCAERVAFLKAISDGIKTFNKIAVVGKSVNDTFFKETLPCGYCRQFMTEFCNDDFKIISFDSETNEITEYTLNELLPHAFK